MDCLIISYSEPSRQRERHQFFTEESKVGSGWGRFLHSNYINFDNDIMLPNHVASIAKLTREGVKIEKTKNGHFKESDIATYSAWKIPLLGGMFLYQHLKSLNFDVRVIQHVQLEHETFETYLRQAPKVIAISTTLLLNPLDIADLVKYCRTISPDSFIVLGGMSIWNGHLANKDNPDIFKAYRADACVIDSKGFKTLGLLVDCIKNGKFLADVPNLILYTKNGTQVTTRNPEKFDFRQDSIKWDLIDDNLMGRIFLVRTQISCPFSCSFCSYPTSQGDVVKTELDIFEKDLQALTKRGVKYLLFVDDTFNVPVRRFKEILNILKQYDFQWYGFIRCQYLDEEQVVLMRESGCGGAYLGIESGHDDILTAMNKRVSIADYRRGVGLLASVGITTYASFIVGFPGETDETIESTRKFIESSGVDFYNVKIFYYDHTTPIAQQSKDYELTGQGMNWSHKTMNSAQAFSKSELLIKSINRVPYIPQHSGEIWEIAYFHEQGFSKQAVHALYRNFTRMIQDELLSSPHRLMSQKKLFNELVELHERAPAAPLAASTVKG